MTAKGMGYIRDPEDMRDWRWRSYVPKAIADEMVIPDAFIRPDPGPVLDQGDKPMCVAFTASSIKMEEEWRETKNLYEFDPEKLYARCKELDGIPTEEGTYPRTMLQVLKDEGFEAADGNRYRIADFVRCETIRQIKEAIFLDGPVALGMQIDSAWESQNVKRGVIGDPTNDVLGGHETTLFGWNDHALGRGVGGFYDKNSWSESWGNGGYAILPYAHFEAYPDWDCWKVIDVANLAKLVAPIMSK